MSRRGVLIWFGLVAAFAALSRAAIRTDARCGLCGGAVAPVYRVDLLDGNAVAATFCCLTCAAEWPDLPAAPVWHVRDEVTGEVVDSTRAIYVENDVVTVPARQDRTHVFKRADDALRSLKQHGGQVVDHPLPMRPDARP